MQHIGKGADSAEKIKKQLKWIPSIIKHNRKKNCSQKSFIIIFNSPIFLFNSTKLLDDVIKIRYFFINGRFLRVATHYCISLRVLTVGAQVTVQGREGEKRLLLFPTVLPVQQCVGGHTVALAILLGDNATPTLLICFSAYSKRRALQSHKPCSEISDKFYVT